MKVTIRAFTGMRPKVAQDLLKPGEAVTATNVLLYGGDLKPLKDTSQVTALTSANEVKSIYRFGQSSSSETTYWFQSINDANFIKGPVDNDTEERTYATGFLSYPSKTKTNIATTTPPYPTTSYPMGLMKPATAPTVAVSGSPTDANSAAESVVYVMTLVTEWSEEGPPSAASSLVSWRAGQTINLTNLATTGVASYTGNADKAQNYTFKRLYRSATGSGGTAKFLFVAELPLATTSYNDTATTSSLNESLRSRYWLEPPDDMKGLTQMANGILAGFSGTTVCFSEPFVPYAWPVRYQQSIDAPAVGCAAFGQSLLVSTNRSLYVFTGTDPAMMTSERLAVSQTCVSKRSMVEMMGGVVFATPDGLAFIGSSGFKMLTDGLMERREWQAYKPESMHAYESDDRYICFYDTGSVQGGMIFTFGEEPSFATVDFYATAGFRDKSKDALFLCFNGGGSTRNIKKWDAGSNLSMTWLSGVFRLQNEINMGVARVSAAGSISFELLADGAVKHGPVTISDSMPFKLPSGYRSARYQVRLTGTNTVRSVEIADATSTLLADG